MNLDSDMAWSVVSRDDKVVYDLLLLGSRIGVDDEIAREVVAAGGSDGVDKVLGIAVHYSVAGLV